MTESTVVPESIMDSATRTLANVEQVKAHLPEFLSLLDPQVLAELPPLERAQSLLLLAKATTALFTLRLRGSGVHPDGHPVKTELKRLSLYQDKMERFIDLGKAPLRPSISLNYQAATRFIEHSLPDLTPGQRQSMKDISKKEGTRIKYLEKTVQNKRKHRSSEKQSVQTAAKEFLDKASRELLGDSQGSFKGPLQVDASCSDLPACMIIP
ncbi:nuclear nucleic acid-binding protein C1D-like [Tripterygium wilfordii]|uniref:Nuclear nucleic acid-binding protein C1D n=1 Tax=Tripterygium wilfordii TaxID=458696 RepID=A0A7J7DP49_TRIWF|nr:nuclear nucleic acid-binding protein C1D-like [Tripterygium wilfordii]KAF5748115.1 nuclear nucleic acid-binding protein C1D-like [Tripterygium wilfordii]